MPLSAEMGRRRAPLGERLKQAWRVLRGKATTVTDLSDPSSEIEIEQAGRNLERISAEWWCQENVIPLDMKGGELSICERPLRAQTMQGERVALASSETAPAGSQITFDVICLSAEHAAVVREWLNYGVLRGLGQWRNSGRGKFVWEELDDNGAVIGGNASLDELERLDLVS